jgi:hypothetical protein
VVRKSVAASLRERGYGDAGQPDDMALIRSCRNSKGLRQVVLHEFILLGEAGHHLKTRQETDVSSRVPALEGFGGRNRIGGGAAVESPRSPYSSSTTSPEGEMGDVDDDLFFAPDDDEVANAVDHLRVWVHAVLRETGKEEIVIDDDTGDVLLGEGSTMVIVGVDKDPLMIEILAIVLKDVDVSESLLIRLNDLNDSIPGASIYHVEEDQTIYMCSELLAEGLTATHFIHHLVNLSVYADAIDHELQREFGGRTVRDLMETRSDVQWV